MKNKTTLSWVLLIVLAVIWGSSFILMKRGMVALDGSPLYSDVQVGALRMAIAGLVMLPFGLRVLRKVTSIKIFVALLIVGFCGNFFPAFLFTFSETKLSSGFAGMLNSFTPFFTILIGFVVFRQRILPRQAIGLAVAFGGICLLVGSQLSGGTGSWIHVAAIVLATLFYGTSLNTIKHILPDFKSWEITALAFTFVGAPALLICWFSGAFDVMSTHPSAMEGLGFITILSVMGTCLALVLFNQIIAMKTAVFASSVTYLIPIFAVIFGVWLNKETVEWQQVAGMLVIVGGVALANSAKK